MEFYKSLARYYDDIFPFHPEQKDFITRSMGHPHNEKAVLDAGCGTGNLALELAGIFKKTVGIDSDPEMIRRSKSKARGLGKKPTFRNLNMLDLGNHFNPETFDAVISFGNTLVHLQDSEEIRDFICQTRTVVKPGGKLLLQIVNYDRILDQNIRSLPAIENERIRFERFYRYDPKINKIGFETILTMKKENHIIKNQVGLYPVQKKEIENILSGAGYRQLFFYGSFKKEKFTPDSAPLIIEAG